MSDTMKLVRDYHACNERIREIESKLQNFGLLASRTGFGEIPNRVLRSAAGYYIGTFDPEDGPISRESAEYWPTKQAAEAALASGNWTQRANP